MNADDVEMTRTDIVELVRRVSSTHKYVSGLSVDRLVLHDKPGATVAYYPSLGIRMLV
jgi:hypothetical protein